MPYCIIATVGQTVIVNSDAGARDFVRDFGHQDVDLKAIANNKHSFPGQNWYNIVMASLRAKADDPLLLRRASAELNHLVPTLQNQPPNRNDRLHFLASETPDGVLAARILADFCREYFERDTYVEIIEGLQVENGDRFRREGLNNLISKFFNILRDAPAGTYQRIINPTGGFKGVVPYLTLIGMLQNVELSYIYEFSSEMIRLAGVPLRLDFEQMEAAYDALLKCSDPATPLSEAELRKALGNEDQPITTHPLWSTLSMSTGRPTTSLVAWDASSSSIFARRGQNYTCRSKPRTRFTPLMALKRTSGRSFSIKCATPSGVACRNTPH